MFPATLAIPVPLPLPLDFTLQFGPAFLLTVLALLDIGALAALRAAIVSARVNRAGSALAVRSKVTPLQRPVSAPQRTTAPTSPPRAA